MWFKHSMFTVLLASSMLAGGCVSGEIGDEQGDSNDAVDASAQAQTASERTASSTGVVLWRMWSTEDGRLRFVGLDRDEVDRVRGTATADRSGETVRWSIEVELPYSAKAWYSEDALEPEPSRNLAADVVFQAITRDIFLGETTLAPSAASGGAGEPDIKIVPRIPANAALDTATLGQARDGLQCLRRFMRAAYEDNPAQSICHLSLQTGYSNAQVKLYTGVDDDQKTRRIVLTFRGSVLDAGDWILDVKSTATKQHNNPLTNDSLALGGGKAGSGWVDRWVNQAKLPREGGKTLVNRLKELAADAKSKQQKLVTYVTGHSLGAATADVASYDIAEWQKTLAFAQEVVAVPFNPPRFGRELARETYQDALKSSCSAPTSGKLCLTRWAMTRALDGVQSLPPSATPGLLDQIVWQQSTTEPGRRKMGLDKNAATTLPYCPQFYAPAATKNPVKVAGFVNHYSTYWEGDIATKLSDSHLACLFRR
ncbi:MAG: hypothetical protein R3F14_14700 [Polyangiaceae bacterium]